jgi:hypothetical protein
MQQPKFRLATAIAVLAFAPVNAFAEDSLAIAALANATLNEEQTLSDNALQPGHLDNSVSFAADIATDASGALGINMAAGDFNLQKNAAVLAMISDPASNASSASTSLLQNVFGNAFNIDSTDATMHNVVSVDISASDDVAGNVGVNAASGAFNVQSNAIAIAAAPASILAQAQAGLMQNVEQNSSTHHNVVNEVAATVILDGVSGNVGMNFASGVGNVQSNSITIARPF